MKLTIMVVFELTYMCTEVEGTSGPRLPAGHLFRLHVSHHVGHHVHLSMVTPVSEASGGYVVKRVGTQPV